MEKVFAPGWCNCLVSTLIKKQKYWSKHADGDAVDAHFANKAVGTIKSLE